jgi:hypothetical protein
MMQRLTLPVAALALSLGAAALFGYRAMLPRPAAGELACRPGASQFARLELLFGMGRSNAIAVSDLEWRAFLDAEVTPRFPDGLTVLTGYGQWRTGAGALAQETSRMLLIWYQPAADSNPKIEAIRSAYKARFGQESVLRVDGAACVSF